jgi:hypothetical protein
MSNKQNIGAFYQCYKNPKAVISAISSFRKFYPESDIFLVSDNGFDYSNLAKKYNCFYKHETKKTGNEKTIMAKDAKTFLVWLNRFKESLYKIKEDYIMMMEDDVLTMGKIDEELFYDMNGICEPKTYLGFRMTQFLKTKNRYLPLFSFRHPYSCYGGTIIKKSAALKYLNNEENIIKILEKYERKPIPYYASDKWMTLIMLYNGASIGPYNGYCETRSPIYIERLNIKKDIKILHQYKEIYNKELTKEEKEMLGQNYNEIK